MSHRPLDPGTADSLDAFLVGSESVAAVLVSPDGSIIEANGAFERLAGSTSSIHDAVVPGQTAIVADLIADAGTGWSSGWAGLVGLDGEPVDCTIWALRHRDHVLVLAEVRGAPGQKLYALLLELNDDLLSARRELDAQNRQLRELDELKNLFLASATHDLMQPLMSLMAYAELLTDEGLPPEVGRMALIIDRNARRMTGMINDLLGAASIMTGDLVVGRTRIDVVEAVAEAVDGIRPAAHAAKVTITRTGAASAPAFLDERRVLQILDNLLSNAVKYSPAGGQVRVDCQVDDHVITIEVTDTGIGISVDDQGRLFDRYFRASTARALRIDGTGHGLANARAYAEAHTGTLTCASKAGVGSTFTLTLPDGLDLA